MFGGRLCHGSFYFTLQNQCVVAFGNRIYLYDETARCQALLYEAKQPIVAFRGTDEFFTCIDQAGNIVQFNESHEVLYQASIKFKVDRAVISEYGVYVASHNKLIFQAFNKKPKEKVLHECASPISLLSSVGVYVLFGQGNNIHVIDTQKPSSIKTIEHPRRVSTVWIQECNLIVGDEKGTITTYLKQLGEKEGETLMEHWHVHEVKALYGTPFSLVSGGEEGVAVMWHRNVSKKDFLPRFGAEILGINGNEQATILAFSLSDNTVRVVDTNNNNQVVTIKQISDPRGTKTQRSITNPNAPSFPVGIEFNSQSLLLCTNAAPGKLQFIDVSGVYFTDEASSTLQVVQRNWVSRLDDSYPCPAELSHICFNESWTRLLVVSQSAYQHKLHFYEYQESWKLVCKVDSPERIISVSSYTCSKTMRHRFVTASGSSVRLWRQYAPKEKSEGYYKEKKVWDCESEFRYREMTPLNVRCSVANKTEIMTVAYPNHIACVVRHRVTENLNTKEIVRELKFEGVLEAETVDFGVLMRSSTELHLFISQPKTKAVSVKCDKVVSWKLHPSRGRLAVQLQHKGNQLLTVIDLSSGQIASSFKLNEPIEGYFWAKDNLVYLSQQLQLVEVIRVAEVFKVQLPTGESEAENESKETTDSSVAPETSFAEHYRKELRKQLATQQKSKLTREIFAEATQIPSFAVSLSLLASELLM